MGTIQKIGFADFERLLAAWEPRRRITEFHVHHTWRPRHRDFRGLATIEAMRRYHIERAGMSDIAQHLTIDPFGGIWTGRPFDKAPASARGHNGSAQAGPFMIEMIGDFDAGQDPFDGDQKRVAYAVIVAVLRKFGLDADAVRFHNQMSGKTCPGNAIALKPFRSDIEDLLVGRQAIELPRRSTAVLDAAAVRGWAQTARAFETDADDETQLEQDYAEVPETASAAIEQELFADLIERGDSDGSRGAAARGVDFSVHPLLPYVINLSRGVLSSEGDISSSPGQFSCTRSSLRAIVEQHLPAYIEARKREKKPAHLLFYSHGGLVDESAALCYARTIVPWWLAHGVYPILFIWESGLLETMLPSWATKRALAPRAAPTDTALEWATQLAARPVWARMKKHAEDGSSPRIESQDNRAGGAYLFAEMLKPLLAQQPDLRLHAVGHSTGPILLSAFMPLLTGAGHRFRTMSYLAPAIRTDRFETRVLPLLKAAAGAPPKIEDLTMYTMTDAAERQDNVAWIYRKSLLYYVRNACEDHTDGRILGLAKDLLDRKSLAAQFGIGKDASALSCRNGNIGVEFSPAKDSGQTNPHTAATKHGGFDNDPRTMFAVLERVLGEKPKVLEGKHQFPSEDAFDRCGLNDKERDFALDDVTRGGCTCCCKCGGDGMPPERFGDDVEPGDSADDDRPEPADDSGSAAPPDPPTPGGGGAGNRKRTARKLALCIGIDSYAGQPLSGCVNDSKRWADTLDGLGFQVKRIIDREATRTAIVQGLRELIVNAREGDELVFQYAGHGTQVDDDDGDEASGFDQAFVPIDVDKGALLLDDDFYRETEALRKGAFLTMFMDCCHSGSNSRFSPRLPATGKRGSDERVRFMTLSDDVRRKFLSLRKGKSARARGAGERLALPGVVHFAACRDDEYAWESNGQGDFTRHASALLAKAARDGSSNRAFMDAIVAKFGTRPRQHPLLLKPATGLSARRVFGGE